MAIIQRDIHLQVPAELVFRYLDDPAHFTAFSPNISEISDIRRHPPENTKFSWVYKMMDTRLLCEAEVIEAKPFQRLKIGFHGGMHGSMEWQLQPLKEGTHLQIRLDYTTPAPLLKKHTESEILQHTGHDVERMLQNLKSVLEASFQTV
jgi:uncharacterized protein YndB with AHSA1/START domain